MAKNRFTEDQKRRIEEAIQLAELNTCGEIRVHIDAKCPGDPVSKAISVFNRLKMDQTEQRNGILIYIAMDDHKLAIIGDTAINDVVPDHFWDDERDLMIRFFRDGLFTEGLVEGIHKVGEQLKEKFPYCEGDKNELDNEISFEEGEE